MSNSIFHVRPQDAGKGWAIDEYDGRGAWQHSVPIGPDGAPMDKIQAQRAVFQLRRKAVNSAPKASPVNKKCRCAGPEFHPIEGHDPGCVIMGVPSATLDWEYLEAEVTERIRALAATMGDKCDAPAELKAKLYADLIQPNVRLLAEFCTNVAFTDEDREPLTDNTGCDT
jgi:hypothetical protein